MLEKQTPRSTGKLRPFILIAELLCLVALLAALGIAVLFPDEMHEYRIYLFRPHPNMDFTFEDVSEEWSESDLKARFPELDLNCQNDESLGKLGDRSCYVDIQKHNGISAMLAVFFFRDGKLETATIHVPVWAHKNMYSELFRTYGMPKGAQPKPISGARLIGWELFDGGAVFYNRDRVRPIGWSALLWSSHRACLRNGCFLSNPINADTPSRSDT